MMPNATLMQLGKVYHAIDTTGLEPREEFDIHIKGTLELPAAQIAEENKIPLGKVRRALRNGLAQRLVDGLARQDLENNAEKHRGIIVMGAPNIMLTRIAFEGGLIAKLIGEYTVVMAYEATAYCKSYDRPKNY